MKDILGTMFGGLWDRNVGAKSNENRFFIVIGIYR